MKVLTKKSVLAIAAILAAYDEPQLEAFKTLGAGYEKFCTLRGLVGQAMEVAGITKVDGAVVNYYSQAGSVKSLIVKFEDVGNIAGDAIYRHVNGLDYSIIVGDMDNCGIRSPIMVGVGLHDGLTYVRTVEEFLGTHRSGAQRFVHVSGKELTRQAIDEIFASTQQ
jgi:hypothetical protein